MTDARVEDSGEYECQVAHHGDMEEEMGMTFSVHVLGEILIKRKSFCNANFDVIPSNAAWLVGALAVGIGKLGGGTFCFGRAAIVATTRLFCASIVSRSFCRKVPIISNRRREKGPLPSP